MYVYICTYTYIYIHMYVYTYINTLSLVIVILEKSFFVEQSLVCMSKSPVFWSARLQQRPSDLLRVIIMTCVVQTMN